MNARRSLRIFLLAGEASGDAYGAALARALKEAYEAHGTDLHLEGWGGDAMEDAGVRIHKHIRNTSFMGFWEVATHLRTILGNLRKAHEDVVTFQPDAVVFIDFPGFNMRLAKRLARDNHPAMRLQWVAPQVWAWKAGRVRDLARDCHAVAPILPFEADVLSQAGVRVWDVGHPLLDLMPAPAPSRDIPLVLLPGSRAQELRRHLPIMVDAVNKGVARGLWQPSDVHVAGAPGRTEADYGAVLGAGLTLQFGQTQELLGRAQFAWVASGTATLEAALMGTPHAVAYRTSAASFAIAKRLVRVKHIGLPNLLLNRSLVPELIQQNMTVDNLLRATQESHDNQRQGFDEVRRILKDSNAASRLAHRLLDELTQG